MEDIIDPMEHIDHLIGRAENLLGFMTEHEAAEHLHSFGIPEALVFLALKAAQTHTQPVIP